MNRFLEQRHAAIYRDKTQNDIAFLELVFSSNHRCQ